MASFPCQNLEMKAVIRPIQVSRDQLTLDIVLYIGGIWYFPVFWFWNLSSAINRRIPKKNQSEFHDVMSRVPRCCCKKYVGSKKNAGTWSDDIDHWILWAGGLGPGTGPCHCMAMESKQGHGSLPKTNCEIIQYQITEEIRFFHLHSFFHAPNKANPLQKIWKNTLIMKPE